MFRNLWKRNTLVCLAAGLVVAFPAAAHHGWGGYIREIHEIMTVTEVRWGNPHDLIRATDSEGTEWTLLLAPPIRNREFGFGPGIINVGDVAQVLGAGHPTKAEAKVHVIMLGDTEVYRYMYSSGVDSLEKLGGTIQQPRGDREPREFDPSDPNSVGR